MNENAPRATPASPSGSRLAGEVLVVDDIPANLFLYRAILEDDGHHVREAGDGVSALRELDREGVPPVELVLLDVSMPGMDGMEVLRRIRARRDGGPAVLVLTAAAREPVAIEQGLALGADAYLTRPVDNHELAARVRAALQIHRLRNELAALRRDQAAMLVHDLRHPLANLSMLAEVLESDEVNRDDRLAAAGTIRRMVNDLGRLVDTILTASTLEAGVFSVDMHPCALASLLAPSIEVFRPLATRRKVTLELGAIPDVKVMADAARLRQVVDNLLANAVKFTLRGGRIRLEAWPRDGEVHVRVLDSGVGVRPEERAVIFDRYRQGVEGRARGGAGLGLAIARGIVEAHGGAIRCEDSPLGGASFVFTLKEARS
jgi:signal transduction histidine kinase